MTTRTVVIEELRSAALQIANDLDHILTVPAPQVPQALTQALRSLDILNQGLPLFRDAFAAGLIQ